MIQGLQDGVNRLTSHPIIGDVSHRVSNFVSITNDVAIPIFIRILVSLPLVYLHHNLFTIGFAFGFVCDKFARDQKLKVDAVYDKFKNAAIPRYQKVVLCIPATFLTIWLWPNVLIIASIYYSAISGSHLYRSCVKENPEAIEQSPVKEVGLEEK